MKNEEIEKMTEKEVRGLLACTRGEDYRRLMKRLVELRKEKKSS